MRSMYFLTVGAMFAAAMPASAATVTGEAKIILGGEVAYCVGVALVPRTVESEQAMVGTFGSAAASSRSFSAAELRAARETADFQRSKDARCGYKSGYRFDNVAPGEYFVLLHARGGGGGGGNAFTEVPGTANLFDGDFRKQAVLLMQPVTVPASGRLVMANFQHKN